MKHGNHVRLRKRDRRYSTILSEYLEAREQELEAKLVPGVPTIQSLQVDNLYSSADILVGGTVTSVRRTTAEVTRNVTEYLLIEFEKDGQRLRLSIPFTEVSLQRPDPLEMLRLSDFFSSDEVIARMEGKSLILNKGEE